MPTKEGGVGGGRGAVTIMRFGAEKMFAKKIKNLKQ